MKKNIASFSTLPAETGPGTCITGRKISTGDPAKKAILIVSFGTSHHDSRTRTIVALEKAIARAYPEYEIHSAFTSQMIIDKLKKRDGLSINNVAAAMQRLVAGGVGTLVVQPTHIIPGLEFEKMVANIEPYKDYFASLSYGVPLLSATADYRALVRAFKTQLVPTLAGNTALLLMGHGSEHFANAAYAALDYMFKEQNVKNVFVGAVENYPGLENVLPFLKAGGYTKVILQPLMIVAGDHACNDMAGAGEDSWKNILEAEGFIVECILKGLGEFAAIQDIYIEHLAAAINQPANN